MSFKLRLTFAFLTLFFTLVATAQNVIFQNIKGNIVDTDSKYPLIGVTVIVKYNDTIKGTTTNIDGDFIVKDVPVGKFDIQFTYVGYAPKTLNNLQLTSGKEFYLNIEMEEDLEMLNAVTIQAEKPKDEVLNEMSITSAKMFTVEETKRYAGSFNDPARMVSAFAGVSSDGGGDNDIVVRGNTPRGILWRLEGVEIPNPNHFSDEGSTGGPINALNSSMLANSDFLTGAFAPEYGNALSGVFDMKLRKGNSDQREYTIGVGVIGTELTLEGPFSKNGGASYLANYRYSTLGILDGLNVVDFGGVPRYQDGSFNLYFPTKKAGTFTWFGLGGISAIADQDYYIWQGDSINYEDEYSAYLGTSGITHMYSLNEKSYIKSVISYSGNGSSYTSYEGIDDNPLKLTNKESLHKQTFRAQTSFNKKFSAKATLKTGLIFTNMRYNFLSEYEEDGLVIRPIDRVGNANMAQAFVSMKYRPTDKLTLVGGIHGLHFLYNNTSSIEPRISARYRTGKTNSITFGYGAHSKLESMLTYTLSSISDTTDKTPINANIKLPKAHHYVLGYNQKIGKNMNAKVEIYYQDLRSMAVENVDTSSFALLNMSGWYTERELISTGRGRNYGVELTLERYMNNNLYFLFTTSLYNSEYKTLTNQWYNSKYNGNYNINFLLGKEFPLKKNKVLAVNIKASLLGAQRYTAIDLESSRINGYTVRDWNKPYELRGENVFFINISGSYQINRPKATHAIKFEVLNATNHQAKLDYYYDPRQDKTLPGATQLSLIPNIRYTVSF